MTDQTQIAALQAQLAAAQAASSPTGAWGTVAASGGDEINNMGVPIKVQTPMGKLMVRLPAKFVIETPPQQLMMMVNNTLAAIAQAGHELDFWQNKKQNNGWGNNNGGNNWGGGNRGW